ncbi:SPFH domain / Band 7 family protein [Prevotella aff. ruminicola Tc2-24]|jgi:regulator of protease activity HflC (stomatin/prohibitin superfamily)|uniref:SPFH domain / Band 7 family protein n=1 Tax=Prevotella aff. ruminicola Tc2-24 TaxID=81582 RepID=A0A1I0PJC6_9BACT|nr:MULTISPECIES: SPFH domain-containing protein [Prevotella]SEE44266.1 SPFH domain / Band 7 family protein [Prevotella sp. lc2012]SEW14556.1 SPFH domain / Band 7 family protein [Prevotella aff. ruminicola Tc2-24]
MDQKEFTFKGSVQNGFLMLFANIAITVLSIIGIVRGIILLDSTSGATGGWMLVSSIILLIISLIMWFGFLMLEPNEAKVTTWFGKYSGTFAQTGFFWINPFYGTKKVSLRARNLDAEPIKVNDKTGNPVMIGLVLVWKLKDTYKALFEVDSQTMASNPNTVGSDTKGLMNALENFVRVQSDAALRQVAGQYAYDDEDTKIGEPTLRSSANEVNEQLEQKLDERLALAGIEVVEARINYLAYAPEIAAVMLRRQQASAIITAREKIVEGAVSMVKMALDKLSNEAIVDLDDDKKAAMVSNLLVVLCGDDAAQPVVNTGTLNH